MTERSSRTARSTSSAGRPSASWTTAACSPKRGPSTTSLRRVAAPVHENSERRSSGSSRRSASGAATRPACRRPRARDRADLLEQAERGEPGLGLDAAPARATARAPARVGRRVPVTTSATRRAARAAHRASRGAAVRTSPARRARRRARATSAWQRELARAARAGRRSTPARAHASGVAVGPADRRRWRASHAACSS